MRPCRGAYAHGETCCLDEDRINVGADCPLASMAGSLATASLVTLNQRRSRSGDCTLSVTPSKQSVVLRLLSRCGWNPFDPSQVVPEYTVGIRRVDFALRPGSANAVFIEVKRPSEKLGNHQQQLPSIAFRKG